jgi:hypothetical protein
MQWYGSIPFALPLTYIHNYIYQKWGNNLKKFTVYAGLFSAFLAFIAEPIMEGLDIYKELNWKHYFSFPIYWILGIGCLVIIKQMKKLEKKHT